MKNWQTRRNISSNRGNAEVKVAPRKVRGEQKGACVSFYNGSERLINGGAPVEWAVCAYDAETSRLYIKATNKDIGYAVTDESSTNSAKRLQMPINVPNFQKSYGFIEYDRDEQLHFIRLRTEN